MQLYNTSCNLDQITIFSLGQPELMKIVDMVGKYYRWFHVSSKPLKDSLVLELIDEDLKKSAWIDAMKCQILLQKKALRELMLWLETIKNKEYIDHVMVLLFRYLHHVTQNCANINNTDKNFLDLQTCIYYTMMMTMSTYPFWYIQASNLPWGQNLF